MTDQPKPTELTPEQARKAWAQHWPFSLASKELIRAVQRAELAALPEAMF